ncbi:universal stress protein [Nocardioides sp. W3-2-3]|uniref:universal stress protein n=1 Tax=Nocardioides convexus TaxID=2712224 RepID=UPI0024188522|nr:universal stress protein [Nocardioides convexus]NGZ99493.1 universal stress protein [Nocardioides convexus]
MRSLTDTAPDEVRRTVGLVDDQPHVFATTLLENVRLARPDAADAEVEDALRAACLGDWLGGLPDGLHTWLGAGHAGVSGGERARIGVARSFLAAHPVLVLDEPTAHLDHATAERLAHEVMTGQRSRSVLWITHGTAGRGLVDRTVEPDRPGREGRRSYRLEGLGPCRPARAEPEAGAMTTSINPSSVVVATDGSEDATRAAHWAAEQAFLERRPLVVVTATGAPQAPLPSWGGIGSGYPPTVDDLVEHGRSVAEDALAVVRNLRPGLETSTKVLVGDPRQVLVDLSRQAHALVLGSRGRGRFRSKVLGSVSATVSRDAACTVFVCRPPARAQAPTRGSSSAPTARPSRCRSSSLAFHQASLLDLPLTVVHCVWDQVAALLGPGLVSPQEAGLEEQRLLLSESVAGMCAKFPEVSTDLRVGRGLAEELLAADTDGWNLLVVGRHPVDTLLRLVTGSVAVSVIERARTTVAVVPEADPAGPVASDDESLRGRDEQPHPPGHHRRRRRRVQAQ